MSQNGKSKPNERFWVKLLCLILAGLMVIGIATTSIFIIVNIIESNRAAKKAAEAKKTTAPVTTTVAPATTTASPASTTVKPD